MPTGPVLVPFGVFVYGEPMARRRMTADERRQADYEALGRARAAFLRRLGAAGNMAVAQMLLKDAPPQGDIGRRFFSNLGFFLQAFEIPNGASDGEQTAYLEFVRRLDAAGELKPGALDRIEERFRQAGPGQILRPY
jgi:hypothetical protein